MSRLCAVAHGSDRTVRSAGVFPAPSGPCAKMASSPMAASSSPPVPKRRRARVSAAEARRIALAAQGFAEPALGRAVDTRALRSRVIDRVGLIQIDSVNVLQRAHYLPAFARLGSYDTDLLDKLSH